MPRKTRFYRYVVEYWVTESEGVEEMRTAEYVGTSASNVVWQAALDFHLGFNFTARRAKTLR